MLNKKNVSELVLLKGNPRIIKDDKYKKLKESIRTFPEMLNLRPLIINKDNEVLGGNMRLMVCKDLGIKEVPIIYAEGLTKEQEKEFIIKDNVNFGEWDWDIIANEWDSLALNDWGLSVWSSNEDLYNIDAKEKVEVDEEFEVRKSTDDKYSTFELIMIHENKLFLIEALNKVKEEYKLEKIEEALMHVIRKYSNE